MVKSKKWILCQKIEVSKAKNLGQLGMILTFRARKAFVKLKQAYIEASNTKSF